MITDKTHTAFNLPYNQSPYYWLAVFAPAGNEPLRAVLDAQGLKPTPLRPSVYTIRLSHPWDGAWKALSALIAQHDPDSHTEAALVAGEQEPGMEETDFARKPKAMLDGLADSLWLGDAMIEDRLVCYMQPVLDKRGKVFGYEAFARVETEKGVIGGGRILEASKGLNVEYILDRHLHVKAITSFISSDLEGFLFINFVPGFIHRPEKYLEGLADAVKFHGMPAKQLVLDFTHSELPRDPLHLKSIFEYCRTKGYSLALDDISSVAVAKKILDSIRPDFIKLDISLVRDAQGVTQQGIIGELVALAHAAGATILAEGVETEAVHKELLKAGVELFQGYLFSPPVPIAAIKKAVG
jgi:EAL domain-containing protein (putative c-di-GMP-specific phosphodiesterase class I)